MRNEEKPSAPSNQPCSNHENSGDHRDRVGFGEKRNEKRKKTINNGNERPTQVMGLTLTQSGRFEAPLATYRRAAAPHAGGPHEGATGGGHPRQPAPSHEARPVPLQSFQPSSRLCSAGARPAAADASAANRSVKAHDSTCYRKMRNNHVDFSSKIPFRVL